jgi:hypothetical protein
VPFRVIIKEKGESKMGDKWYDNPNCDWFDEERKHKKILRGRIMSACKVAMWVSAFSIFGLVGSADLGKISLGQFMMYELVAIAILVTAIRIKAILEEI